MNATERSATGDAADHWFGFRRVGAQEKTRLVGRVFDSVAGRYDLMNDLMSGGAHRLWKRRLIALMTPRPGERLLDVAGGTGDVAFAFLRAAGRRAGEDGATAAALICDASPSMLAVGRDKAVDRGMVGPLAGGLDFVAGRAEALPLPDRSVDVYSIAFGLRNVTEIDAALAEARRVLRPGGRFYCLEFSRVVLPVFDRLYDRYSFAIIPRLGRWVAGDRESYQYLVESIRQFPEQPALAARMRAAGLWGARWVNLSGGIAAIHRGWRV